MKVLFLTAAGELLGLAERIAEKHEVKAYVAGGILCQLAGMGRIDRVTAWRPEMKWADLVVADYPLSPAEQSALRDRGRLLFGVGNVDVNLEEVITEPPTPDSLPFSVTGLWNGHGFTKPLFYSIGLMHQLAGDLGPLVGNYMATHIWQMGHRPTAMEHPLGSVENWLTKSDYRGPVTIDFYHNLDGKLVFGSVHPRPIMMLLGPMLQLMKMEPLEVLSGLASGGLLDIPMWETQVGAALRLYGPPWPYMMHPGTTVPQVIDIGLESLQYSWLTDVVRKDIDDTSAYYFGSSGSLGMALATGRKGSREKDHFREATRRLQNVVKGIDHPMLQYRTDTTDTLRRLYRKLQAKGYK